MLRAAGASGAVIGRIVRKLTSEPFMLLASAM
jgi:hypothetical protein